MPIAPTTPFPFANTPESSSSPKALPAMSERVAKSANALRNIANLDEFRVWLGALGVEKLGPALLESGAEPSDRLKACGSWLSSVGRKWMEREGAVCPYAPEGEDLNQAPNWMKEAIRKGARLQRLSLLASEREVLAGVLDWMRSKDGPSLGSDWSKISARQAIAAEKSWIDAKVKAALKKDLEAADAAGTELFAASDVVGPDGSLGWRWVEVKSAEALDREGALMRHCVGSYAEDVAEGEVSIFSLRDPDNKPHLTVEAAEGEVIQIKAFANHQCPSSLEPQLASFASAFSKRCEMEGRHASASEEAQEAGLIALPGYLLTRGQSIPAKIQRRLEKLLDDPKEGEFRGDLFLEGLTRLGCVELAVKAAKVTHERTLNDVFCDRARAGDTTMLKALLPMADPKARGSRALEWAAYGGSADVVGLLIPLSEPAADGPKALLAAAYKGNVEAVKLLLPVSSPIAGQSAALISAAQGGHIEVVKLLLPVSNPTAQNCLALTQAARMGHTEVVELLLSVAKPDKEVCDAFINAAGQGNVEIAKLLIPFVNPKQRGSLALRWAAGHGQAQMVELLLPISDPKAEGSRALMEAIREGHTQVARMLLPVSDLPALDSSPIRMAIESGHMEVVTLINEAIDQKSAERYAGKKQKVADKVKARRESKKAPAKTALSSPTQKQ